MMDKKDKIALLDELIETYKNDSLWFDKIIDLLGISVEGELFERYWKGVDRQIAYVSMILGDEWETIAWYIYDNECGEAGFTYLFDGCETNVNNTVDLLDVIDKTRGLDAFREGAKGDVTKTPSASCGEQAQKPITGGYQPSDTGRIGRIGRTGEIKPPSPHKQCVHGVANGRMR